MKRKSEPNLSQFISLIVGILIIGGICELYNWIFKEKSVTEIEQEFAESMPKSTVEFFNNFECGSLQFTPKTIRIKKTFVLETNNTSICKLFDCQNYLYSDEKRIGKYITDNINDANVIIWINNIGKKEGNYSNGSPSIRKYAEINFIEKETKSIYKKVEIPYLGKAPQYIKRNAGLSNNEEFFGDRPDNQISTCLLNEIKSLKE